VQQKAQKRVLVDDCGVEAASGAVVSGVCSGELPVLATNPWEE